MKELGDGIHLIFDNPFRIDKRLSSLREKKQIKYVGAGSKPAQGTKAFEPQMAQIRD